MLERISLELEDDSNETTMRNRKKDEECIDSSDEENDPNFGSGDILSRSIEYGRNFIRKTIKNNKKVAKTFFILVILIAYNGYLAAAIRYAVKNDTGIDWCDGLGFLIIVTGITYWSFFYYYGVKRYLGKSIRNNCLLPLKLKLKPVLDHRFVQLLKSL